MWVNKMKQRAVAFLLACMIALSLTACGAKPVFKPENPGLDVEENGGTDSGTGDDNTDPGTGDDNTDPGAGDDNTDPGAGDGNTDPGAGDDNADPGAGDDNTDPGAGGDNTDPGTGDGNTDPGTGDDNADPNMIPVQCIEIRGAKDIYVGGMLAMSVLIAPSEATNQTLHWSIVSGGDLATIDEHGRVTAHKPGKIVICAAATDGSGIKDTVEVTIFPAAEQVIPIETVSIYFYSLYGGNQIYVGDSLQFGAHIWPENATNQTVKWSLIRGADIASIDQNGLLTAHAPGLVWVNAVAADGSGHSDTHAVVIEEPLPWKGSGTREDPYQVGNAEELRAIERRLGEHTFYFLQTADIDLSDHGVWWPLGGGKEDAAFRHHYDGGNHVIRNVEMPHNSKGGIFGHCIDGSFRNLHIENAYTTKGHTGLMAAFSHYAKWTTFENCSATVNFPAQTGQTAGKVGGLVALYETSGSAVAAKNCSVSGYIQGTSAGGLFGMVDNTNPYAKDWLRIENCSSSATVEDCGSGNVGGLIGIGLKLTMADCTFSGIVNSVGANSGGLAGKAMEYCTFDGCTVTGTVTGGEYSESLVGWKSGTVKIQNCIVK